MEYVFLGLILAICLLGIVLYNRLVALRQARLQAFNDIDVQLKLRCDLVPNLVETVRGYAGHESAVFEKVTNARASAMGAGNMSDRSAAESTLSKALVNLYAVAENYPDLKANQGFLKLQDGLTDIENKIAAARRFMNNATQEYNTAIEQFPANLIAGRAGFSAESFFTLDEDEKQRINITPTVNF